MRADPRTRPNPGFAVAWMLVLVALIALAGGAAVHDVLFAQQLANTRAQQQRAMGMAELGLRIGMQQLVEASTPQLDSGQLHPGPLQTDTVQMVVEPGALRIPAGFSAARVVAHDYEIQSTGQSARNARRVLVQGMTRLEAVGALP